MPYLRVCAQDHLRPHLSNTLGSVQTVVSGSQRPHRVLARVRVTTLSLMPTFYTSFPPPTRTGITDPAEQPRCQSGQRPTAVATRIMLHSASTTYNAHSGRIPYQTSRARSRVCSCTRNRKAVPRPTQVFSSLTQTGQIK